MENVELIGYLASAAVLISFLMKDINKLRLINSIGCILFIIYGFMLSPTSWPVIITNTAIVMVNVYYVVQSKKEKKHVL